MNPFGLKALWTRAQDGPVLRARLIPLSNQGDMRLQYIDVHEGPSIRCLPSDTSPFEWVLGKSGDKVTLSPPPGGIYASVRPELSSILQLWVMNVTIISPPPSFKPIPVSLGVDFITSVGPNETMTLHELGFFVIALQGMNGQYLTVDGGLGSFSIPPSFPIVSNAADSSAKSSQYFLGVTQSLQAHLTIPTARETGAPAIAQSLAEMGVADAPAMARMIAGD